jgi:PII-like signaling protein
MWIAAAARSKGDRMSRLEGDAVLARIHIGESDHWHGKPLRRAIVELLKQEGLAGVSVFRGIEGFGADSHIHTTRILRLSEDLPIVIEVVDTESNIQRMLPRLDTMVAEGVVTTEKIHVVAYRGAGARRSPVSGTGPDDTE